jgi:glycosyltransferase involved in cell wall biosynthesis/D-arabinose 1-dehydrogenase-like Zn-dependent alcohol dehydrogenase
MLPETSIVIRTLNEGKNLEKVFQGIHNQNYKDWEIVLVDSGSTDRTLELAKQYGARIFHIPSDEFTFGRSLNQGCGEALGEYLVFVSGHVWPVTNNWLRNLVEPFQEPSVAMVYGRQRGTDDSRLSELHDLQRQFGPVTQILVDEPKGNNGNAAIRKSLWLNQPFDESLPGLEDVDWARKAERNGNRVYYAADASVFHLHEETLKQVYTRHLREAVASKRMFPHNQFTWSNVIMGLPYFIFRDVLFAFRQGKRGKLFQILGNRIAQFLGMHKGMRYQQKLGREIIKELTIPETHQQVEVQGVGQHSLRQNEIPPLQPDQLLVQVAYVVVGSKESISPNCLSRPNASDSSDYPFVPGREFSGIVVQSGSQRSDWKRGQKVARGIRDCWEEMPSDGDGRDPRNSDRKRHNMVKDSGAYAQYIAVTSDEVQKLPTDMPLLYGVWVPHVASFLSGLRELGAQPGQSACVTGAGPIANLCAQVLLHKGLRVKIVDANPKLLAVLRKYDIDTGTELTSPEVCDYIVDASMAKDPLINDWNEAVRLVNGGTINLSDHTSVVYPLEDYQDVWAAEDQHYKVLLSPNQMLEGL